MISKENDSNLKELKRFEGKSMMNKRKMNDILKEVLHEKDSLKSELDTLRWIFSIEFSDVQEFSKQKLDALINLLRTKDTEISKNNFELQESKKAIFTKNNEISRYFNEATQVKLKNEELEKVNKA